MSQPQAFLGGPVFHPPATPIQNPPPPVKPPAPRLPSGPANTTAVLSITRANHAYRLVLTKPLLAMLGLRSGDAFDLSVPVPHGGPWLLDITPKPEGAGYRVPAGIARLRIRPIAGHHFRRPQPVKQQASKEATIVANQNVLVDRLYFQLGPQVPGHPGYYHLQPVTELPSATPEARQEQRRLRKREQGAALREQVAGGVPSAIERQKARQQRKREQAQRRRSAGSVPD